MRGACENACNDGIPHGEWQHGVHHEDDEQEKGHLGRIKRIAYFQFVLKLIKANCKQTQYSWIEYIDTR